MTTPQTTSAQARQTARTARAKADAPRPQPHSAKHARTRAQTDGQTRPTDAAASAKTTTKAYQKRQARAHDRVEAKHQAECAKIQSFAICHPHAAGIDIGQGSHWVCVGYTEDDNPDLVREFPSHSEGLRHLIAYLREHQVNAVAMESTGVYWIPLFELLLKEGFQAILVPPQYTRQVQGRPKTDKRDCQWIYRLHSVGLLPAAFRPPQEVAVLRAYLRERTTIVHDAARHIQRMQKALEQMNLKLTTVVDDITGLTGQKIIAAMLKGTRDPHKLAQLRHPHCQADAEQFALALDGTYRDEHLFALRQASEAWRFYQKQLDKVDEVLIQQLQRMKQSSPLPPLAKDKRRGGRKANALRFDAREALYCVVGVDLTELEGLSAQTALTLISEIGTELSAFATVKHFCSWLGLCPHFKKTGGQVKSSRTRPGQSRAAALLRQAASSLHSSKGALGAFLRRLKGRMGVPGAVTATAHKLARLVYYALTRGMPYVRQTQEHYEAHFRQKQIQQVLKKARALGLEIKEKQSSEPVGEKTRPG